MTIPDRIARLPKDKRNLPIPWNVLRGTDDSPLFTVNDDRKHWAALRLALCPICGERLGRWKWFAGGPLSAFHPHGWYSDLPMHHDCATFALATCPYLAAPRYDGRVDVVDPSKLPAKARFLIDGTMIPERPPLFVAVASATVEVHCKPMPELPTVRPARPALGYEFWQHGQQIPLHRAMPILRGVLGADWQLPEVRS